jgi:hypothetical protein
MIRPAFAALVLASIALVPEVAAPQTTRVDGPDPRSTRTGGVIVDERTGRVDVYDRDANRLGHGQVDRTTGRVDFFDARGNRIGSGTITPSGEIRQERR